MTDLDRLIVAVDAGSISRHDLDAFIPWRGLDNLTNDCLDAYNGSLDAALRLHEALLPGWEATVAMNGHAGVMFWPTETAQNAKISGQPARAWLLAILRALKAKGDA